MENGNLTKLLWALNMVEGSGQQKVKPRHEPNFYNKYLKGKKEWAEHEKKYGAQAISSSYGPWQIMYPTAVQYGYKGTPSALADPKVSLPFVQKVASKLSKKFSGDIEKVFSAYNAGEGGVGSNPEYVEKAMENYKRAPSYWIPYGQEKSTKGEKLIAGPEKPAPKAGVKEMAVAK